MRRQQKASLKTCLPDGVLIFAIFWVFQRVDRALLRRETIAVSDEASGVLVPDCSLPNVTYSESLLDRGLLHVFRMLVTKETGYASKTKVRTDCSNHFLCCSTGSIFFDASRLRASMLRCRGTESQSMWMKNACLCLRASCVFLISKCCMMANAP